MKLLGVTRSSNQDVAEGYGPAIQEAEFIAYAATTKDNIIATRHVTEPATIALEDRQLFQAVMAEATQLKRDEQCDGLLFSRCDRLSRQMEGAIQVALDLRKVGLAIVLVRENQVLKPDDPPINFVMFILQAFGVDSQTRISLTNLKAGQHRAASEGKLPAGAGPGLLGYNLVSKHFEANSFITVCDEVLERGYRRESINQITRDLQVRGVHTPSGKLITRSTVALILRKARRYTGIWDWGGHEIRGLIPPRITEEKANAILANLKRNREKSFGFGKRKWLTGRVNCGLCARKYRLQVKRWCCCSRSDPLEACPPCLSPRIRWKELSHRVWMLFIAKYMMNPNTLLLAVADNRKQWEQQMTRVTDQIEEIERQISRLQDKRQRFSWQHANRIIDDDQLLKANKAIQTEFEQLAKQLADLKQFVERPAPPDTSIVSRFLEWWPSVVTANYEDVTDELKESFAEVFDIRVTVFPGLSPASYRLRMMTNIPLEILDESPETLQMVLTSPQCQGERLHSLR